MTKIAFWTRFLTFRTPYTGFLLVQSPNTQILPGLALVAFHLPAVPGPGTPALVGLGSAAIFFLVGRRRKLFAGSFRVIPTHSQSHHVGRPEDHVRHLLCLCAASLKPTDTPQPRRSAVLRRAFIHKPGCAYVVFLLSMSSSLPKRFSPYCLSGEFYQNPGRELQILLSSP